MLKIKEFLCRFGLLAIDDTVPECSNCTICFDLANDADEVMLVHRLPCGHIFHKNCILRWLTCNSVCPNCRREVGPVSINNSPGGNERTSLGAGVLLWPRGRPPVSTYVQRLQLNSNTRPWPNA